MRAWAKKWRRKKNFDRGSFIGFLHFCAVKNLDLLPSFSSSARRRRRKPKYKSDFGKQSKWRSWRAVAGACPPGRAPWRSLWSTPWVSKWRCSTFSVPYISWLFQVIYIASIVFSGIQLSDPELENTINAEFEKDENNCMTGDHKDSWWCIWITDMRTGSGMDNSSFV